MKRTISFVLALVLVLSLSGFSRSFAVTPDVPTFEVSSAVLLPGESADINIYIRNNPGVASVKILVSYDSGLVLDSVTYGEELGGVCQVPNSFSSPVTLNYITLSPVEDDVLFATLRFTVESETFLGDKPINITFDPDDICDIDENNLDFAVQNGKITVVNCKHVNTEIRGEIHPTIAHKGYSGDTYCLDCGQLLAVGEEIFAPGDANADGLVDIRDIVRIKRYLLDNSVEISEYADISGNGEILPNDISYTICLFLELGYAVKEQ